MRIVTYNILLGGRERLSTVARILGELKPTVVGLQECHGEAEKRAGELEAATGLRATVFQTGPHGRLMLLAPHVWVRAEVRAVTLRGSHGIGVVRYEPPGAAPLTVAVVHLDPGDERVRVEQVEAIGRLGLSAARLVLLGDFNSLSFADSYSAVAGTMLAQYVAREPGAERPWVTGMTRAVERLGLVDAAAVAPRAEVSPTWPTPAFPDPDGSPPIRIDFVYVTPDLAPQIAACRTHTAPPADRASDHYPVVVDFDEARTSALRTPDSGLRTPMA